MAKHERRPVVDLLDIPPSERPRRETPLLVILGMHRSGTSALTESFSRLGYNLGPDSDLVGAGRGNVRGHFEYRPVLVVNDWLITECYGCRRILPVDLINATPKREEIAVAMTRWQDAPDDGPFLVKDPRLCVTLPWWLPSWPESTAFVLLHRHPSEVAGSLEERQSLPLILGELAWFLHVRSALVSSEGHHRVAIEHHRMVLDPVEEIRRTAIAASASTGVPVPDPFPALPIYPTLVHQSSTLTPRVPAVEQLWNLVRNASRDGLPPASSLPELPDAAMALLTGLAHSDQPYRSGSPDVQLLLDEISSILGIRPGRS